MNINVIRSSPGPIKARLSLQTHEAAPTHQRREPPAHLHTNRHPLAAIAEDALPVLHRFRVDDELYLGEPQPQRVDHRIGQVTK